MLPSVSAQKAVSAGVPELPLLFVGETAPSRAIALINVALKKARNATGCGYILARNAVAQFFMSDCAVLSLPCRGPLRVKIGLRAMFASGSLSSR
jgi:hypothetical protein